MNKNAEDPAMDVVECWMTNVWTRITEVDMAIIEGKYETARLKIAELKGYCSSVNNILYCAKQQGQEEPGDA